MKCKCGSTRFVVEYREYNVVDFASGKPVPVYDYKNYGFDKAKCSECGQVVEGDDAEKIRKSTENSLHG